MERSPLPVARAVEGGLALRRRRPAGSDAVLRCSCWLRARAVVGQARPDGVRSTWL